MTLLGCSVLPRLFAQEPCPVSSRILGSACEESGEGCIVGAPFSSMTYVHTSKFPVVQRRTEESAPRFPKKSQGKSRISPCLWDGWPHCQGPNHGILSIAEVWRWCLTSCVSTANMVPDFDINCWFFEPGSCCRASILTRQMFPPDWPSYRPDGKAYISNLRRQSARLRLHGR
jgi:hypothetical protein